MPRLEPLSVRLRRLSLAASLGLTLALAGTAALTTPSRAAERHGGPPAEHGPAAAGTAGSPNLAGPEAERAEPELGETPRHEGAEGEAHTTEGEHGGGMPQLDAESFPSQIFWLIVAFAGLYYLLRRKALPRVAEILEARQERIGADLDRAARLRSEAEEAQRRHEQVVAEAQTRASAEAKAVQERVQAEIAKRQAGLDAGLGKQLAEAESRIGAARERALSEVQNVAAEVAAVAVERLAGLKVGEAEVRDALARVTAEAA
jgi:F-type H+-transporting ATPase subunit b